MYRREMYQVKYGSAEGPTRAVVSVDYLSGGGVIISEGCAWSAKYYLFAERPTITECIVDFVSMLPQSIEIISIELL